MPLGWASDLHRSATPEVVARKAHDAARAINALLDCLGKAGAFHIVSQVYRTPHVYGVPNYDMPGVAERVRRNTGRMTTGRSGVPLKAA